MALFVTLDDVWAMLEQCLPGHTKRSHDEYWTVQYNGRSYRRIPVGPHGRKQRVQVKAGHIRSLVRFFEIEECADARINIRG